MRRLYGKTTAEAKNRFRLLIAVLFRGGPQYKDTGVHKYTPYVFCKKKIEVQHVNTSPDYPQERIPGQILTQIAHIRVLGVGFRTARREGKGRE